MSDHDAWPPNPCEAWFVIPLLSFKVVIVGNVRNADDQHAHATSRAMDDSGGDMYQRAFLDRVLQSVQAYRAAAVEDVIELGGTLMIMESGAINIDRMC